MGPDSRSAPREAARPAVEADHPAVLRLATEARAAVADARGGGLLQDHDLPLDVLEQALAVGVPPEAGVWVGTLDGHVVGYAFAAVESLPGGGTLGVLREIVVEPDARQVGVGEALLDQVMTWARALGCRGLDAWALPGDRATKNFFETAGLVARAIVVHRDLTSPDPQEQP